ncbi:DNA methyltransferase, partial [Enterococcus faecium]
DGLFEPQIPLSRFTVRDYADYSAYQFKPEKSLINRINGELCTFNTIQIIKRYQPRIYVIENPASSRMWEYIERVLGFYIPFDNLTYYNNYDYPISKATKFKSNIQLDLKKQKIRNDVKFNEFSRNYNERSNIPLKLVATIFEQLEDRLQVI